MRIWLAILATLTINCTMAQTHTLPPARHYIPGPLLWQPTPVSVNVPFNWADRRWQVIPYSSVSAGYIFYNGGISYLSAPTGLMLVKPLSNNWAAYSSLSVTPTVFSMSRMALPSNYLPSSGYGLNLGARVEGGLIYTNDDKTFSISGSLSVERGSYPVYQSSNQTSRPGH